MANSQASVSSIINYRSQRRLILLCILMGTCLMASVAVILSQNKAISTSTDTLEKKQQVIDDLRNLASERGDLNHTLADSLEAAEGNGQTLYDSIETQEAAYGVLKEKHDALVAQLQAIDAEWLEKLHAEETKSKDLADRVSSLEEQLTASRTRIADLEEQIDLEQSTNKSLLVELAALKTKQANERDKAQIAVDAWRRALLRSEELKNQYEVAIKDGANNLKLSDSEWGIPKDPDPTIPGIAKSEQMRMAYYLAWCEWNAFHDVDLDGTPEDYRESHLTYTASLEEFLKHLTKDGQFIFKPSGNVLIQQRDNKSTYLAVVEKYRRLSAEERAIELAAALEKKEDENTALAERLVEEAKKYATQTNELRKQETENAAKIKQIVGLDKKVNNLAMELQKTDRELRAMGAKLAKTIALKEKLEEQLSEETKAENAARAAKLLVDQENSAPVVVAAWKKADLLAKTKKKDAAIAAAISNAKKNPELANVHWGLPEKAAVGLNAADRAFIQEQLKGRERYLKALFDYEAFDSIDLAGTSAEYREAHDAYTESLRNLATGGLRRINHKGKAIHSYDPRRQMPAHVIIKNKYEAVLDKYRKWEGLIP